MLSTPTNHLPDGYPLASVQEELRFQPIFSLAFEIHDQRVRTGQHKGYRSGVICPVEGHENYCDCYEQAYREFVFIRKVSLENRATCLLSKKRRIIAA